MPEGFSHLQGHLDEARQVALLGWLDRHIAAAPWFQPTMPRWGTPLSVRMSNAGPQGWVADKRGYRYEPLHPDTGRSWPPIPDELLALWDEVTGFALRPECCLINFYRHDARMGLHQDRDEAMLEAPVVSVSLGNAAVFRIGGTRRGDPSETIELRSGDVCVLAGPSRLAFHGIDRIRPGSSDLVAGGGRINMTLRRVTRP